MKRLTHEPGYDGGPFFSPDGKRIVYRRDVHADAASLARYQELLAQNLYRPGALEIWVMDADGANKRQVTKLGAASFAPYFHPDGKRIVFSSNHPNPRGRAFDIYMIGDDGNGLERVTSEPSFDGFPMFSPDGKKLVFASNRGGKVAGRDQPVRGGLGGVASAVVVPEPTPVTPTSACTGDHHSWATAALAALPCVVVTVPKPPQTRQALSRQCPYHLDRSGKTARAGTAGFRSRSRGGGGGSWIYVLCDGLFRGLTNEGKIR